jgi:hypothetical protein
MYYIYVYTSLLVHTLKNRYKNVQRWLQQEHPGSTVTQRPSAGGNTLLQILSGERNENLTRALGRISRQKVRIYRDRLFDSALKVIGLYASSNRYLMEIEVRFRWEL